MSAKRFFWDFSSKALIEKHAVHDTDSARDASYSRLAVEDNSEEEVPSLDAKLPQQTIFENRASLLGIANLLLFGISLAGAIFTILRTPTDAQCARVLSTYSPALEAVEYETYTFQNSFNQSSIYRGPPTPERENAWNELMHGPGVNIPLNKLHLLNKSTEVDWLRTPEEAGGGVVALLEVVHQLHCLGMVRKWLYREWYDEVPPEFDRSEELMRMHIGKNPVQHPSNIFDNDPTLISSAATDVTPVLAIVDRNGMSIRRRGDFESWHKCRNFSKIFEWMQDHAVMA
ncbi:hypothetical protein ZTR_09709 [Talaromyces verruculosus]|nr:hypothetical protein ZTR_09709 [Talaromyces verruculosus]